MVGTLVLVAVVALLLGGSIGWLERGRRCRRAHAHLVARHERGDLEAFLGPEAGTGESSDPVDEGDPGAAAPLEAAEPADVVEESDPESEVRPGAFPRSALPGPGGAAPGPAYVVKAKLRSRIYHTTASPSYAKTIAEVWFRTGEDAEAAGFRAPRPAGRSVPRG